MHSILRWPLFVLALFGTVAAQAQAVASGDLQIVGTGCTPQRPRFPARYAGLPPLRNPPPAARLHRAVLSVKDARRDLGVEASLEEIDLTGNGSCDLLITVLDPIDAGGDSEALSTLYLANAGQWQRVGARSAARADMPSDVNPSKSAGDENYEFSEHVVMRRSGRSSTYVVAWHAERISNGFAGYRVLAIDPASMGLKPLDKWNGEGALVYAAFKRVEQPKGSILFEPSIEARELESLCDRPTAGNAGLAAACIRLKR